MDIMLPHDIRVMHWNNSDSTFQWLGFDAKAVEWKVFLELTINRNLGKWMTLSMEVVAAVAATTAAVAPTVPTAAPPSKSIWRKKMTQSSR